MTRALQYSSVTLTFLVTFLPGLNLSNTDEHNHPLVVFLFWSLSYLWPYFYIHCSYRKTTARYKSKIPWIWLFIPIVHIWLWNLGTSMLRILEWCQCRCGMSGSRLCRRGSCIFWQQCQQYSLPAECGMFRDRNSS